MQKGVVITPKIVWRTACAVICIALFVTVYSGVLYYGYDSQNQENGQVIATSESTEIPYNFRQSVPLQKVLSSPLFALSPVERPLRLPDLRSHITFLGCNERPDLSLSKVKIQFLMRGGTQNSVFAGEKVYIRFDSHVNRWVVSDKPTSLSIMFSPGNGGVEVKEELVDEKGNVQQNPTENSHFFMTANASPQHNPSQQKWEIGGLSVDATLLERQGALWVGRDEMVRTLGGEEFEYEAERERIQFGAADAAHVLWAREGDTFIYDGERWEPVELGAESKGKILMRIRNVEEKCLRCDIWSPDGSSHVVCVLNRREDKKSIIFPEVKLLGARSQRHWIAEIKGKRVVLSPTDWLLFTDEGCVKIDSEDFLDDYIQGKKAGVLLVLSGVERAHNKSNLIGTFFDASRSYKEDVSIPLYQSSGKSSSLTQSDDFDDEDDDDVDDDDDDLLEDDDDDES